ncbi:MAG: ATP-binding cassette domain-containing protein [Patescibacteria group bacterium]
MSKKISIRGATANNLKNIDVDIPLGKLVVFVGRSGSGKSSLAYDVIYRKAQGQEVGCQVSGMPANVFVLPQKVKAKKGHSLGETNRALFSQVLLQAKKGDLLILDEPCAGFCVEERQQIVKKMRQAVLDGINIIAVEHNREAIVAADFILEFGPSAGSDGGRLVFAGSLAEFKKSASITAKYAFTNLADTVRYVRQPTAKALSMQRKRLVFKQVKMNGVQLKEFSFQLASLVSLTGCTGVGKSTLLQMVYGNLFKGKNAWKLRGGCKSIDGKTHVRRSYLVDQAPLGGNKTSTPATYLGIWDEIRKIFAQLPDAKKMHLTAGSFSRNTAKGKKDWQKSRRVQYKGQTIEAVEQLTVDDAARLFSESSLAKRKLGLLQEVGLGYLVIAQRATTLSGGEAQRVKLAKILSKKLGDRCVYLLDTPSRGLHTADLPVLVAIFQKIIDKCNTVVIAENRLEILNNSDEVIRL